MTPCLFIAENGEKRTAFVNDPADYIGTPGTCILDVQVTDEGLDESVCYVIPVRSFV